jgi:hypothetical protein
MGTYAVVTPTEEEKTMLMRRKRHCITALVAAAIAATLAGSAGATDYYQLADLGYSVSASSNGLCQDTTINQSVSATGFGAHANFGSTCDAGYQAAIDAFAAGHPERKLGYEHPSAVSARATIQGKGYAVSTDYAAPAFTVTGDCNVNSTIGPAELVGLASSLPTSAPCPSPPAEAPAPGAEPPAAPPAAAPTAPAPSTLEERVAAIEAQLRALAARVTAIKEANDAAWKALVAAFEAGYPPHLAALAARSAGLNAMYQLG